MSRWRDTAVTAGRATVWLLALVAATLLAGLGVWFAIARDGDADDVAVPRRVAGIPRAEILNGPATIDSLEGREPASHEPHAAAVERLGDSAAPIDSASGREQPSVAQRWDSLRPSSDRNRERSTCELVALDADDRPVVGARVEVWGTGKDSRGALVCFAELVTDEGGRCRVQPPLRNPHARLAHPQAGCSGLVPLNPLSDHVEVRVLVVPLRPIVPASVRVLLPDGLPAAGAVAYVREEAGADFREPELLAVKWSGDFNRADTPGQSLRSRHDGGPAHIARSLVADASGRITFEVHLADAPRLVDVEGGMLSDVIDLVEVATAGREKIVRLVPAWHVRGRCLDADGRPVSGARVALLPDRSAGDERVHVSGIPERYLSGGVECTAGDDGRFEFEVFGPLRALIWTLSPTQAVRTLQYVTVSESRPEVDVVLQAGVISPEAEAVIAARREEKAARLEASHQASARSPAGPFDGSLAGDGDTVRTSSGGADAPSRNASLRVVVTQDGHRVPYAWVNITPAKALDAFWTREGSAGVRADGEGVARFDDMYPGRRRVDASSGGRSSGMEVDVPKKCATEVTLELR